VKYIFFSQNVIDVPLFRTINLSSNIAKEKSKAIIHSAHEKYIYIYIYI
jgi:hypothetical protein